MKYFSLPLEITGHDAAESLVLQDPSPSSRPVENESSVNPVENESSVNPVGEKDPVGEKVPVCEKDPVCEQEKPVELGSEKDLVLTSKEVKNPSHLGVFSDPKSPIIKKKSKE